MNYKKLYNKIIQNRVNNPIFKKDGYCENHHIIPTSLGGSNDKNNLVNLSAREHFVCHYLLAKMYKKETVEWYKMNHAFIMMKCDSPTHTRYFNSRLYEALRSDFSNVMSYSQSGKKNSQYGSIWISHIKKEVNKKIPKNDLSIWEMDGWIKGRNKWKLSKCKFCDILCKKISSNFCSKYCSAKYAWSIKIKEGYNSPLKGKVLTKETISKMKKNRKDVSEKNNPMYGRRWIYSLKLDEAKLVKKDELEIYLSIGWVRGKGKGRKILED